MYSFRTGTDEQKTLAYVKSFQPDSEGAEEEEDGHEVDVGDVMVAALALQHTRIAVALNLNNNRHNQIFLNPDNLISHLVPLPPPVHLQEKFQNSIKSNLKF